MIKADEYTKCSDIGLLVRCVGFMQGSYCKPEISFFDCQFTNEIWGNFAQMFHGKNAGGLGIWDSESTWILTNKVKISSGNNEGLALATMESTIWRQRNTCTCT